MAQSMQFDCSNKKSAGYIYISCTPFICYICYIYITSEKPVHDQSYVGCYVITILYK